MNKNSNWAEISISEISAQLLIMLRMVVSLR
jgi:hypothetical protein